MEEPSDKKIISFNHADANVYVRNIITP